MLKTNQPIKVDGELNDLIWSIAPKASHFNLKFPNDRDTVKRKTEAQICYDDKFLYAAFTSWDTSFTVIQSLKRDIGHIDNDGVGIILDPMNLHTTGFIFVVNAFNAQSEDQISNNQRDDLEWNWNNKWFSATKRYDDRWTAEMAIPLKTLRFPPDIRKWGINFIRVDIKNNQYSLWTKVPANFKSFNLGFTGALEWDSVPPVPGKNIVMIPYASGNSSMETGVAHNFTSKLNAGLDAKLTMTSSLNLDLTVNPDFSQVEVDKQVTNLTRYNLFFPERRSFFLENSDIFGEYGIPTYIQPFYSRRIGLDKQGNRLPILGGARLSGSISPTTRIGLMNIQTGGTENSSPQNYSAVSVNQNIFGRSVIKGYFLNRQEISSEKYKYNPQESYSRNAGLTLDMVNASGKWSGWLAYHQSMKPNFKGQNLYMETGVAYNGRRVNHDLDFATIGKNYFTDMGFVQRIENYDAERDTTIRVGFWHIYEQSEIKWFPKKGIISRHALSAENYIVFNPNSTLNERSNGLTYKIDFNNTSTLNANILDNFVDLLFPISFTGSVPLPKDQYHFIQSMISYISDSRKILGFSITGGFGGFYNGQVKSLGGSIIVRSRPHVNVELRGEMNKLIFPGNYGSTQLFLISPRIEINFNTNVAWTTFLQYNTQANNFNINSRFQYRFRPMSDIYLVYTDNYFTDPFLKNKNRAIVFKVNYWLNL